MYSIVLIYHNFFVLSLVDEHLGSFQFGRLWIKLLWTFTCRFFVWTYVFISLGYVPRSRISGSCGMCIINFIGHCKTVFESGCTIFPKRLFTNWFYSFVKGSELPRVTYWIRGNSRTSIYIFSSPAVILREAVLPEYPPPISSLPICFCPFLPSLLSSSPSRRWRPEQLSIY